MLETDEGQAAYNNNYAPGGGCDVDSGEEGLAVLPRHTKVLVTGNNRTKSVLVGLQGVVKKAVGLGGWHWLVSIQSIL
jgi:histone deacetylase complex subunit SAP30